MKRQHLVVLAISLIAVFFGIYSVVSIYIQNSQPPIRDPAIFTSAVHFYEMDLERLKQPIPGTVSLQELVAKGYIKPGAARAFDGMEVTFALTNGVSPQAVFISAKLPDGSQILILNDGSSRTVQH